MASDPIRLLVALLVATLIALVVNRRGADAPSGLRTPWRWLAATTLIAVALWLAVLIPVATADLPQDLDPAALAPAALVVTPLLLLGIAAVWVALAWGGDRRWRRALGLGACRPLVEMAVGVAVGIAAWAAVLVSMMVLGSVLLLVRGELPGGGVPPPMVVWLAGLPVAWRLGLSVAAGLSEEIFFRGLLQSRLGIVASTSIFVLAHVSYGAPLMLVGLTLLSLGYGVLVRRRRSVWAAVTAHAVFDGVQLLVVIPAALAALEAAAPSGVSPAALVAVCYAAQ